MADFPRGERQVSLPEPLPDFSQKTHFPGLDGNPFDVILHRLERLEEIPALLFFLILVLLAWLPNLTNLLEAALPLAFMTLDWALLAMLPRRGISFGPARPPVLLLALCRALADLFPPAASLIIQAVASAVVCYSTWIEPHRLSITRQALNTRKLPQGLGLRILHLGDLHMERITARERQIREEINCLEPDLILFSGDFLNLSYLRDSRAHQDLLACIRQWKAPLGVYAVTGSPAVDLPDVIPVIFKDESIHFLDHERVTLKKDEAIFDLAGLNCSHKPHVDSASLEGFLPASDGRFNILLYHSPDLAPQAAHCGVDLQLSGHTHGGQIRLPLFGPIFTGSLFGRAFQSGRYRVGEMTLYITRGIGMEGAGAPRARFLCPPEIILWEINP